MKIRPLLLLSLLPLLGMMKKCEREPVPVFTLPPATESGANTFGFLLDGRVWRNYGWLPYTKSESDNLKASYSPHNSSRNFSLATGQIGRDSYESFYLTLDSLRSIGTYRASTRRVGTAVRAERGFIFNNEDTKSVYSYVPSGSTATTTITKLDTVQHIIAGTFFGTLRSLGDTTKTISITAGRFDVKYQ